jgi:hypothetical protein
MDLIMSIFVMLILAHIPIFGVLGSAGNTWARREIVGLTSAAARRAILGELAFGVLLMAVGAFLVVEGLVDAIWLGILGLVIVICGFVHYGIRRILLRRGIRTLDDLDRYRHAQGIAS